jgi:signal transduction histidine kinase
MTDWISQRDLSVGWILGIGVTTMLVHVYHASRESEIHSFTLGALIPLSLSLILTLAGVWLFRSDLGTSHVRRVAGWTGVGLLLGVGFGYPVVPYQAAHGITMVDIPFLIINWMTAGALGGFSIGYYDARQQQYRAALETERSELATREQELARQNKRLDRFASVVSHDLRNPLNIVAGRLDLLEDDCDSEHVDPIRVAVERMNALIEDVLALARQGQPIDETESVSLSAIADRSWGIVEAPEATLRVDTDATVLADESRLQQLLENLFRNAVEHGGEGVTISLEDISDASGFRVADDGQGIATVDETRLFEPGYSTSESGTGLGLAIVKEIVEAHGWSISVVENPTGGTRFEIRDVDRPQSDRTDA